MQTSCKTFRTAPRARVLAAAMALALVGGALDAGQADAAPRHQGRNGSGHGSNATLLERMRDASHFKAALAQFEASLPAATSPTRAPTTLSIQSLADSGAGSLRAALSSAVDGDVIDLTGTHGRIALKSALITTADVTIKGPGKDQLVLDAAGNGRVIASGGSLTLSDVSLVNGTAASSATAAYMALGGCLMVDGDLQLMNATISGCTAGDATTDYAYGGAIAVDGNALVKYSSISDSSATASQFAVGGGIAAYTSLAMYLSTVSGNRAEQVATTPDNPAASGEFLAAGGGVAVFSSSTLTYLFGSTITGNTIVSAGGAYTHDNGGTPEIRTAPGYAIGGGSISARSGIIASTISGNTAQSNGKVYGAGVMLGAYHAPPSPSPRPTTPSLVTGLLGATLAPPYSSLKYADVSGNQATSTEWWAYGGGVMTRDALQVQASAISNNQVTGGAYGNSSNGGGIAAKWSDLTIGSSTLNGNAVVSTNAGFSTGGGLWTDGGLPPFVVVSLITNSTISGNTVSSTVAENAYAGGVAAAGGFQIDNSTIAFNTSTGANAGLSIGGIGSTTSLHSTIISNNQAAAGSQIADLQSSPSIVITGDHNLVLLSAGASLPADTLTVDPLLLPLAFNGGPTKTHALQADSPAIDTGSNPSGWDFDQRGYARSAGAAPDIGAFERDVDRIFTDDFDWRLGGP